MPASRAVIEALTGAPLTRSAQFAAAGLDPAGTTAIRQKAAIRRAKEKAHSAGGVQSIAEKTMRSIGQAPMGPAGMVEPFVHDPADTPAALRIPSNATPYGQSAEHRTQQREALMGDEVPGYAASYTNAQGSMPGYAPMIDDAGAFSAKGAGINALSAALMLAAAPAAPAAASEAATADLAARGVDVGVREAGARAAAAAGQAGAARMGGMAAGALAPKALTGGASRNPYSRGAVSAGASLGTSLLEPAGAVANANVLGPVADVLKAPGSLAPDLGTVGNAVTGNLPNVAGTSQDVLRALAAQKRSRFRALLSGMNATPSAPISDPFGNLETPALPGTERLL